MTFGAFIAIYFNVTHELPIVTAAVLPMLATALLSVALSSCSGCHFGPATPAL